MVCFFLPYRLSKEQYFKIVCCKCIKILEGHSNGFVYIVVFHSVDRFSVHVKVSSGHIKIFCSHDVHALDHFKPSSKQTLFVFIESKALISFVEMIQRFVKFYYIVSFPPIHSFGQSFKTFERCLKILCTICQNFVQTVKNIIGLIENCKGAFKRILRKQEKFLSSLDFL